jgi:hypothetical protein
LDNDGAADDAVTAYAIVMNTNNPANGVQLWNNPPEQTRADNLLVRNAALQTANVIPGCPQSANSGLPVGQGDWFFTTTGNLVKPFQVFAVTVPLAGGNDNNAFSAVQYQQDRFRANLNTFGAYFRYDLEVFPGPQFNWNGRMFSESNVFIGGGTNFNAYLISDRDSCFYNPSTNSIIQSPFQLIAGSLRDNNFNGGGQIHIQDQTDNPPIVNLRNNNDSVTGAAPGSTPDLLAIDPGRLYTQNNRVPRYANPALPMGPQIQAVRDPAFAGGPLANPATGEPRAALPAPNQVPPPPFVDDTYRADDRCGPRPNYGNGAAAVPAECAAGGSGASINAPNDNLLSLNATATNPDRFGLDGYWERRARAQGMRIIVGQRLNLLKGHANNPDVAAEIDTNNSTTIEVNEIDNANPAMDRNGNGTPDMLEQAVQATAVYHQAAPNGPDLPLACLSTLSSNVDGAGQLQFNRTNATNVSPIPINPANVANTRSREFAPPAGFTTGYFTSADMAAALNNLANVSGDGDSADPTNLNNRAGDGNQDVVEGAFPPVQEVGVVGVAHPNSVATRHGNFSDLRRALENLDNGTAFAGLSVADQSYIHTSACSLGMLAEASVPTAGSNNVFGQPALAGTDSIHGNQLIEPLIRRMFAGTNTTIDNSAADALFLLGPDRWAGTADDLVNFRGADNLWGTADDFMTVAQNASYNTNVFLPGIGATAGNSNPGTIAVTAANGGILLGRPAVGPIGPNPDLHPFNIPALANANLLGPDNLINTQDDILKFSGADNTLGTSDDPFILATLFWDSTANSPVTLGNIRLQERIGGARQIPANAMVDINIYNGRERMVVRTLDLDLNVLRTSAINGDFLLPRSGIVYAFREDSVREDGIARPAGGILTNGVATSTPNRDRVGSGCGTQNPGITAYCVYTNPYGGTDPALTASAPAVPAMGGLSSKPVDYFTDPLRRPHAFRLRNGATLGRPADNNRGLSFITDNPVYVEGNFNLHTRNEFTTNQGVETGNYNNFYNRSGLNNQFADGANDAWRPSEILSDAITITNNFNNDAFPNDNLALRLNGTEGGYGYQNPGNPGTADVNAILVSGLVPSRTNQSYGGLHNFPRFLQGWGTLRMAGSFVQLNFSTQATAPFDQDSWPIAGNPTPTPTTGEPIAYYGPPQRRWGYDVGLQYAPVSPAAARFNVPLTTVDEFVQELPADDPYILMLRQALQADPATGVNDPNLP